jgi:hypothetical protein
MASPRGSLIQNFIVMYLPLFGCNTIPVVAMAAGAVAEVGKTIIQIAI